MYRVVFYRSRYRTEDVLREVVPAVGGVLYEQPPHEGLVEAALGPIELVVHWNQGADSDPDAGFSGGAVEAVWAALLEAAWHHPAYGDHYDWTRRHKDRIGRIVVLSGDGEFTHDESERYCEQLRRAGLTIECQFLGTLVYRRALQRAVDTRSTSDFIACWLVAKHACHEPAHEPEEKRHLRATHRAGAIECLVTHLRAMGHGRLATMLLAASSPSALLEILDSWAMRRLVSPPAMDSPPPPDADLARLSGRRVLLVNDDCVDDEIVQLFRMRGLELDVVSSHADASKALDEDPPSIFIVDVYLDDTHTTAAAIDLLEHAKRRRVQVRMVWSIAAELIPPRAAELWIPEPLSVATADRVCHALARALDGREE